MEWKGSLVSLGRAGQALLAPLPNIPCSRPGEDLGRLTMLAAPAADGWR